MCPTCCFARCFRLLSLCRAVHGRRFTPYRSPGVSAESEGFRMLQPGPCSLLVRPIWPIADLTYSTMTSSTDRPAPSSLATVPGNSWHVHLVRFCFKQKYEKCAFYPSLLPSQTPLLSFRTGADGFVVVDLIPDEAMSFVTKCRANQLSFIPLVSPTTTNDRLPFVASAADSFIYCVRQAQVLRGGVCWCQTMRGASVLYHPFR